MKTSLIRLGLPALVAGSLLSGCAISPDYSNYDWHARGGIVEEEDRSLASARIEPFRNARTARRPAADEPLTPPGAPPSRTQAVVVNPDNVR